MRSRPILQATLNNTSPMSPAIDLVRKELRETDFADAQRQRTEILALAGQQVEGQELGLFVVLARSQCVEIRNAVFLQHDHFAIEDKALQGQLQCG
jgi:FAD synthase